MEKIEKIIFNESESEIQIHHLKKHLQAETNQKNKLAQKVRKLEDEVEQLRKHLNSDIISKMTINERHSELETEPNK
jgi:hypothetical protein